MAEFQEALELDPGLVEAQVNLGNVLARRGRTAEAIVGFERALQLDPDFTSAHNGLGCVLSDVGARTRGSGTFKGPSKSIRSPPKPATGWARS